MSALTDSPEWQALAQHQTALSKRPLNTLFGGNPDRFARFSLNTNGLLLDFSKNHIDTQALDLFNNLAQKAGLKEAIEAMFSGDVINNTEQRPALHVALRSPEDQSENGQVVHQTLKRMTTFVEAVTRWQWQGFTGSPITDVVNIGIGGSDLGPAMVYSALSDFHLDGIRCHFVSNVDPAHLEQTLEDLDQGTTLFVIASKTFTTMETMLNAQSARRWLLDACDDSADNTKVLAKHLVAVSTNVEKAVEFGIPADNIFPMWDWVGGRYSLWSAIGLPVALGIGMDNFRALLAGAHDMDNHFRSTPATQNIPVMMALLDCWYQNFFATESRVVLPYSQQLHLFPAYLQQLDMESLGKSVTKEGAPVDVDTGGIVWGSAGTNGQHSFHQLLHQGSHLIPADFIAIAESASSNKEQHQQLLANCFAQSQALMDGKSLEAAISELLDRGMSEAEAARLAPHKVIPGNRPSTTLLLDKLSPQSLGSLIACYEQKVFARSVILGINAFDQWGVELGKVLSTGIYNELVNDGETSKFESSTNALINRCK
ncbi:MAG: glucose-6-phosphate isomerase [Gammaproteobacteria bacterium]|nr:glucose-6-phosphate isomerase [Gammaproteobacteria bacterium]